MYIKQDESECLSCKGRGGSIFFRDPASSYLFPSYSSYSVDLMVQNGCLGSSHPIHISPRYQQTRNLPDTTPTSVAYLPLARTQSHGFSKLQGRLGNVLFIPGSDTLGKTQDFYYQEEEKGYQGCLPPSSGHHDSSSICVPPGTTRPSFPGGFFKCQEHRREFLATGYPLCYKSGLSFYSQSSPRPPAGVGAPAGPTRARPWPKDAQGLFYRDTERLSSEALPGTRVGTGTPLCPRAGPQLPGQPAPSSEPQPQGRLGVLQSPMGDHALCGLWLLTIH